MTDHVFSPTAHWLFISGKGGKYHEQLDAHAPADADESVRYRFRFRDPSPGNVHGPWLPGRAPGGWQ